MAKKIALNVGYYNTKVNVNGQNMIMESRIQPNESATRNYIVFEGVKYEVGNGVRNISNRHQNFTHLICTYYNVVKYCKDMEHVELIVALPINQYLNVDMRKEYVQEIEKNSPLLCEVDGVLKKVFIDKVICYMEAASVVLANEDLFDNCVCGVIDIGGNTVNCAVFNDSCLITNTTTCLDLGTIKLEKDIIDEINVKKGWNVQDYEIKFLMNSSDKIVSKVVQDLCTKQVKTIKQKLIEKKWSLGSLLLYFTGGGSLLLKDYIVKEFENFTISQDCLFDNENGLEVLKEELDVNEEEYFHN